MVTRDVRTAVDMMIVSQVPAKILAKYEASPTPSGQRCGAWDHFISGGWMWSWFRHRKTGVVLLINSREIDAMAGNGIAAIKPQPILKVQNGRKMIGAVVSGLVRLQPSDQRLLTNLRTVMPTGVFWNTFKALLAESRRRRAGGAC